MRPLLLLTVGCLWNVLAAQSLQLGIANDDFDLPSRSDRYFTSGVFMRVGTDWRTASFQMDRLAGPAVYLTAKTFTLRHNIYTPENIYTTEPQLQDRPFTSTLTLSLRKSLTHRSQGISLHRGWQMGVMGKLALGKQLQNGLHSIVDYAGEVPGWRNQLRGDVVINYNLRIDKIIVRSRLLSLTGSATGRIGTLYDDLGLGSQLALSPLKSEKVAFSLIADLSLRGVMYDATLSGGLFNPDRRYRGVIRPDRLRGSLRIGSYLRIGKLMLAAGLTRTDRSFVGGDPHGWGWVTAKWN